MSKIKKLHYSVFLCILFIFIGCSDHQIHFTETINSNPQEIIQTAEPSAARLPDNDIPDIIVYKTRTSRKVYHIWACSYLNQSKQYWGDEAEQALRLSLQAAFQRGLEPCSQCQPPRFDD